MTFDQTLAESRPARNLLADFPPRIRKLNKIEALLHGGADIVIAGPWSETVAIKLSNMFRRINVSCRIDKASDHLHESKSRRPARVIIVPLPDDLPSNLNGELQRRASVVLRPISRDNARIRKIAPGGAMVRGDVVELGGK